MSTPAVSCIRCKAELPAALEGVCARCLLSAALDPLEPFPEEPLLGEDGKPRRFGKYELVERIARGGMGEVFKARDVELGRLVALKTIAEAELISEAQVHALKAEARIAASLAHPNIVPVYEVGEHEERYYFAMKLMEGGSLADARERYQSLHPWEVAGLVETIARAVYYGHQNGILHRDLKPANVLLDATGVPHVADFGLAKAMDLEAGGTLPDWGVGTQEYWAPEQAHPTGKPLTVAADVYSLGVILYELLTGQRPFKADSEEALLDQVLHAAPPSPRGLQKRIPRDLEAICLKCLEKEPGRRYRSAAELADDLQRYRQCEPVQARPRRVPARAWLWSLRNRLGAAVLVTLLAGLPVAWLLMTRAQADDLRGEALRANVYAASNVAGTILFKLGQDRYDVERAAQAPEVVAALQKQDNKALESFCQRRIVANGGPESSSICFVQDTQGKIVAAWPPEVGNKIVNRDYGFRDYYLGAKCMAEKRERTAYLALAFEAEATKRIVFAMSAPVYASDGTWIGVLVSTWRTDSTLGTLRLNDPSDPDRAATLVGLTDRKRGESSLPGRDVYAVIAHDRLRRGMHVPLDPETARQLARALPEPAPHCELQFQLPSDGGHVLEGYRDPVSNEPGTWLAAFAPVGRTGFVVIVQTSEKAVLQLNEHMVLRTTWWLVSVSVSVGLIWLFLRWLRDRSLPPPPSSRGRGRSRLGASGAVGGGGEEGTQASDGMGRAAAVQL